MTTDSPEIAEDIIIAGLLQSFLVKAGFDTDLEDHWKVLDGQVLPEDPADCVIRIHEVAGQDDHLYREGNGAAYMEDHPGIHTITEVSHGELTGYSFPVGILACVIRGWIVDKGCNVGKWCCGLRWQN